MPPPGDAPKDDVASSHVAQRPRAALLVAHPGHELRVHHWMERERPLVFVLTHGDGHDRGSRLSSTTRVLEGVGARPGSVYGRWRDADLYAAVLAGDVAPFAAVGEQIAGALEGSGVTCLAADAEERYNPSHDICRYLASAVATRLRSTGRAMLDLEFPLVAAPDALLKASQPDDAAVVLTLDDAAIARKIQAARKYPEMHAEVEHALETFGIEAFRRECLTPVVPSDLHVDRGVPFYETFGERQVAAGKYREVLRYATHVRPLRERLAAWASASALQAGTPS